SEPGKILDQTRELVIKEFEKSEEDVKDGMDISICSLNPMTKELKWAGANNPLWIIPKAIAEQQEPSLDDVIEIKPDKQPIGKYADPQPFTTHSMRLNEGDTVYIFTDGYADQFGGPKGKKFKYKAFKELLLEVSLRPMNEQRTIINDRFEAWRGDLEQIDDVCIIAVKV
ncbi:MAG: SpoIIE family protein phosphatase, partial [Flavobacteriales bacterium]